MFSLLENSFPFGAQASLQEVLEAVPQLGDMNQVRLWLCGELPTDSSGSYEGWVLARELRQRYTTGARVVLQKIGGKEMEREWPDQTFLGCHSKELGDERNLPSHIPFCHALQLPFAYHVHHLEAL
ncbi:hypothetical protein KSZ_74430 [Dictyobacter formicarum]|uniref:Uncharacterized protein n=1 Tax=Dictyobacter formicarum TaxID=2778368 RepID=A0ABQ3VU80_9CHLR|nr:hypothetical protein KSZ_74430 [Dictyobacter formicarum]